MYISKLIPEQYNLTSNKGLFLMLTFNCTKAAAKLFTKIHKGKEVSCILPDPGKTIGESIASSDFMSDDPAKSNFSWHWVVDRISIKKEGYFIVVDCLSNYCLAFPAVKKNYTHFFLHLFNEHLFANFDYWGKKHGMESKEIKEYIARYNSKTKSCVFYQRVDQEIQVTLQQAITIFKELFNQGRLIEKDDFISFSLHVSSRFGLETDTLELEVDTNSEIIFAHEFFIGLWLELFNKDLVCSE